MFTFLKNGSVAFVRSDAEQADWTQEQLSLVCTFPYMKNKVIERGMVILFQDPATAEYQAYEIRNVSGFAFDGYQQLTAECISVSELHDCHIPDDIEITDKSIQNALNQVLTGTGWQVGNVASGIPVSSVDIGRGDVWQAVCDIRNNFNVYILPRVTVNASGISGRYLDVVSSAGTWRGLRLAVNKNLDDPCVTYDDSELYTAFYAYGASYTDGEGDSKETKETKITDVVWSKTDAHPAKPAGRNYIEWPEKTALYGRNGKPRYGYYQNSSIDDPNVLCQKAWESLKQHADPKISITGTALDLKRLGYADQPLRLYDMAIIELEPLGLMFYKQIIQLTVNLLNPDKNMPNIGDYIPNIIYINRQTDLDATGGGRAGGGGGTRNKKEKGEFETIVDWNERNIILHAHQLAEDGSILRQAGMYIDPITGVLIYADDNENMIGSKFEVQSNRINAEVNRATEAEGTLHGQLTVEANKINAEVSRAKGAENTLSGRITVEAGKITQIVRAVGKDGEVTAASICLAINNGGSTATINANKIYLLGQTIANTITANYIQAKVSDLSILRVQSLGCSGGAAISGLLNAAGNITTPHITLDGVSVGAAVYDVRIQGPTNNVYTLQKQTITGSGWTDVGTFSRATALNGDWSRGTYTVTASPQGNTIATSVASDPGNARRDGNIIYIPLVDGSNEGIGKDAMVNFTNVLTEHTRCVAGLTRYAQQVITLYTKVDGEYFSVGQHYWYYKDQNSALTTYYD